LTCEGKLRAPVSLECRLLLTSDSLLSCSEYRWQQSCPHSPQTLGFSVCCNSTFRAAIGYRADIRTYLLVQIPLIS
jgi:hypothetical protein